MTRIVTTNNPVAIAAGRAWQIEVNGKREFGPASLSDCITALPNYR